MAFWRKISGIAGCEAKVMMLGESGLEGIGQFPAVYTPQVGSQVGNRLGEFKNGKVIENHRGLLPVSLLKTHQHFGTCNHRNRQGPQAT